MIAFNSHQRYWLYCPGTDMRKSFDALSQLVSMELKRELFTGEVFIFINRRRDRIKLLVWDRSGFVIFYKRLEAGTFELPVSDTSSAGLEITWENLVMILEGIKLKTVERRRRYSRIECKNNSGYFVDKS